MKKTSIAPIVAAMLAAALLLSGGAGAGETDKQAKKILQKADKAGWSKASHMLFEQTITTTSGSTRTFKVESWAMNGDEKQLMRYLAPPPSKGIGVLTLEGGDNIWVYFPDSDDLRKIASSARNQSVEGSDFTYEDMATTAMSKKYEPVLDGEEEVDGIPCHKLELKPLKKSMYSKLVIWVDKSNYAARKIEYYDKKRNHEKTLRLKDLKQVKGVWVARELVMENHKRGSKTTIKVQKIKINPDIDAGIFTTKNLTII
ncbi:MAG: outer membrane lipoprotein-sorting protein [Pseudomonadota bacterium]